MLIVHLYEVIPGGLNGILIGLKNLRDGKASAVGYACRIEETEVVLLQETLIHKKQPVFIRLLTRLISSPSLGLQKLVTAAELVLLRNVI